MPRLSSLPLSLCLAAVSFSQHALVAEELTYESHIRPILKEHCFHCHGEQGEKEGGLDLRLRRFLVRGGESGPAIVPGDANGSLLVQRVVGGEMPPEEDKRLPKEKVEILRKWVGAGAPTAREEPESLDDQPYFTAEERNWWSFQPLKRPSAPPVEGEFDSPIDRFITQRLQQVGPSRYAIAPKAVRATRIRRLYLGMLGVPPTPEETERFVEDTQPAAWPRLVDRVLASPRYGEHWGGQWLDVAGYADSEGYTDDDTIRESAWRYRDYVIRAWNQDKPYSRFVTEQLAGDEIVGWPRKKMQPDFIEPLAATGFLRMAPDGTGSKVDQDVARNQVIADTLEILGGALLGVTIQCARCHDHRYDPITQSDYYQLRAVFEPAFDWKSWRAPKSRRISLYTDDDKRIRDDIEANAKKVDAKRQERIDFYIARTLEHELLMLDESLQQPLRTAFQTKPAERTKEQKKLLADHVSIANITAGSLYLYDRRRDARAKDLDRRRSEKLAAAIEQVRESALMTVEADQRELLLAALGAPADKRSEAQNALLAEYPAAVVSEATLEMFDAVATAELKRYQVAAEEVRKFRIRNELDQLAKDAKEIRETIPKEHYLRVLDEPANHAPTTYVFFRGDHKQPKQAVEPGGLSVLGRARLEGDKTSGKTTGRRLRLAKHLTSVRHPLTARVITNRIWGGHFGKGIVGTLGDFGFLGAEPTHPQLLDWLAVELVESGWSIKRLHRQILLSRTYQQSNSAPEALLAADPENRWLGRFPIQRLRSESLRDSILHIAGALNAKMYGESIPVMEDAVGQIVIGKENLDGERKPTKAIPLNGEEFRRSVYVQVRRSRPLGMLESFDLPELAPNCTDRPSSNVAPQSLMMMNSDFVSAMADMMAHRLIRENEDPQTQLRHGWRLAYGVPPSDAQLANAEHFLEQQTAEFAAEEKDAAKAHHAALSSYCQALFGSTRFLYAP